MGAPVAAGAGLPKLGTDETASVLLLGKAGPPPAGRYQRGAPVCPDRCINPPLLPRCAALKVPTGTSVMKVITSNPSLSKFLQLVQVG